MLLVRKMDWHFQFSLSILIIIFIPAFYLSGFGLLLLGFWQLLSAGINSYVFIHHGLKREIKKYWLFTGVDLFIILLSLLLVQFYDPDDMQVIFWTATAGAVPIAAYYLIIYNKLIEKFKLKKELGAFTK